jgi:hypothetical protein
LRAIDFGKNLYLLDLNSLSSPAVKVPLEWNDLSFSPIVRWLEVPVFHLPVTECNENRASGSAATVLGN